MGGAYSGGLENMPRFHENWGGTSFGQPQVRIRGAFISLFNSTKADGAWGNASYTPPNRDWNWDSAIFSNIFQATVPVKDASGNPGLEDLQAAALLPSRSGAAPRRVVGSNVLSEHSK